MSKSKHSIVLDLDHTLLHGSSLLHEDYSNVYAIEQKPYLRSRLYNLPLKYKEWIFLRSGIKKFLEFIHQYFENVIIWSAGTEQYVHEICKILFPVIKPFAIFTRSDTDFGNNLIYKRLNKLYEKYPQLTPQHTFIVDDSLCTFDYYNPQNGILIPAFWIKNLTFIDYQINYDKNNNFFIKRDQTLEKLIQWFDSDLVRNTDDIRNLDKVNIFTPSVNLVLEEYKQCECDECRNKCTCEECRKECECKECKDSVNKNDISDTSDSSDSSDSSEGCKGEECEECKDQALEVIVQG